MFSFQKTLNDQMKVKLIATNHYINVHVNCCVKKRFGCVRIQSQQLIESCCWQLRDNLCRSKHQGIVISFQSFYCYKYQSWLVMFWFDYYLISVIINCYNHPNIATVETFFITKHQFLHIRVYNGWCALTLIVTSNSQSQNDFTQYHTKKQPNHELYLLFEQLLVLTLDNNARNSFLNIIQLFNRFDRFFSI